MSLALANEIEALNAIYGPGSIVPTSTSNTYILRIPRSEVSLQIQLPEKYPEIAPEIAGIESTGQTHQKGYGKHVLYLASELLQTLFVTGAECLHDLIEELTQRLEQDGFAGAATVADNEGRRTDGSPAQSKAETQQVAAVSVEWHVSEVQAERKSTFIAHACAVDSAHIVPRLKEALLEGDKKLQKATHNITAWRIRDPKNRSIIYQDCDDDGETAAGSRLLHLLQTMEVWNVFVMVSRWYGGVKLGPDRFRLINRVARQAIQSGPWMDAT